MAQKRSKIKAYKRKWKRMPKSDRVFVMKFLGAAFLMLILIITLFIFLIFRIFHYIDVPNSSAGNNRTTISESNSTAEKQKTPEYTDRGDDVSADKHTEPEENLAENVDVQLLARLINAETGSSSEQAQIAVASVVMNRVNSEKFPDTIFEVIYQRGQYSPTWNGTINNSPDEQAVKNAIYVYQNGSQIPSNVLYQSRYIQGSGVWAHIDGNYFCYE